MFSGQQRQFRDCLTYEERWEWLQSDFGQRVLSVRPRIHEAYVNGKLQMMIRDPHWIQQLNQWLIVANNSRFDRPVNAFDRASLRAHHSPASSTTAVYPFSEAHKLDFLIHGYMAHPNLIPPEILDEAVNFLNNRNLEDSHRPFISDFTTEPAILNLFYKSQVHALADTLLYGANPHPPTVVRQAQIAQRPPQQQHHHPLGAIFGFSRAANAAVGMNGKKWHIDGLAQESHSPFSLLIGVALSDQFEENSGNLCVFPGSHHSLSPFLKEFVSKGYLRHLQLQPGQALGPNVFEEYLEKPSLESPTQLLLSKGDVVVVHQKVAHRGSPNYSKQTRNMIYFRVASHHHHLHSNTEENLDNIWLDFQGMKDVL
jgi:hypothetical protein